MSYEKVAPQVIIDLMNNTDLPEVLDIERESFLYLGEGILQEN